MIINNWIVVLFCWIVFSLIIIIGSEVREISITHDWFLFGLTFPISTPILIIGISIAFIIKIFRKIKNKIKKTLDKKKKI